MRPFDCALAILAGMTLGDLLPYLQPSVYIDFDDPIIARKAGELAVGRSGDDEIAKACFEFVRDSILHSGDYAANPVTCKASDVLRHGTGFCYAKSHLLAALLRANGVPAGLCYQRLAVGAKGPPWCLHGLNAVFLEEHGWYRIDARGNKPGVNAAFCPPIEKLAFGVLADGETDLVGIWPEPLPEVVRALTRWTTVDELNRNLPDIEIR
jgi:hypothetical protein